MDILRTEHPRIFVNDWQPILDKTATDENAKRSMMLTDSRDTVIIQDKIKAEYTSMGITLSTSISVTVE